VGISRQYLHRVSEYVSCLGGFIAEASYRLQSSLPHLIEGSRNDINSPADVGFLCDKAGELGDTTKWTLYFPVCSAAELVGEQSASHLESV